MRLRNSQERAQASVWSLFPNKRYNQFFDELIRMPELPEVETTLRGLKPNLQDQRIKRIQVHQKKLRWPVPASLSRQLLNQTFRNIKRRGKYLIFSFDNGHMLVHLGMSGSLRLDSAESKIRKHDHLEWWLENGTVLRFHDPRRFGSIHWLQEQPLQHPLLINLGPEPLEQHFDGSYLYRKSTGRKTAVKNFIMDSHIVVGVGNIYASESLFLAGIYPGRAANNISGDRYTLLANAIKTILKQAIKQGGTTLRDFVNEQGSPGYFSQKLSVYGKHGEPCPTCHTTIKKKKIGQRSSYYCSSCQR